MYRPFLATRYLLARPVSWLAMAAIGIGVAALITVVSVMNGFLRDTMAFVRGTTADVLVLPAQGAGGGRSASREDFERFRDQLHVLVRRDARHHQPIGLLALGRGRNGR